MNIAHAGGEQALGCPWWIGHRTARYERLNDVFGASDEPYVNAQN
jgi:hypothetical protein